VRELHAWLAELAKRGRDAPATTILATRHGTQMKASFLWRLVKRVGHRASVRPTTRTCGAATPPHAQGCPRSRNSRDLSQINPHILLAQPCGFEPPILLPTLAWAISRLLRLDNAALQAGDH
jgi:hypothetical protein